MAIDKPKPAFIDTDVTGEDYPYKIPEPPKVVRTLDIDDMERVQRYKKLYGGCLSDALWLTGIVDAILDHEIKPLRAHDIITGRCLPRMRSHFRHRWRYAGSPVRRDEL